MNKMMDTLCKCNKRILIYKGKNEINEQNEEIEEVNWKLFSFFFI